MKIIASDFDGTINYQGKISEEDKIAIAKFRKEGNKFGIVTGRDLELASWIKQENGFEYDFVICCTGAVIRDGEGNLLYVRKGKTSRRLNELFKKAIELNVGSYTVSNLFVKSMLDVTGKTEFNFDAVPEFTHTNNWFYRTEDAIAFSEFVKEGHLDLVSVHRNGNSVDMPPPSTSKVSGIYEYAKAFKDPEIYTVGDNINDIPMLKEFRSFAVSNALEEVKKSAKYQCNRVCDMIELILGGKI